MMQLPIWVKEINTIFTRAISSNGEIKEQWRNQSSIFHEYRAHLVEKGFVLN